MRSIQSTDLDGRVSQSAGGAASLRRRVGIALLLAGAVGCAVQIRSRLPPFPEPPPDDVETRLYLIGDAGAPNPAGEPVLQALGQDLALDSARSLVVYLGDNVYPRGLPDSASTEYPDAVRRLDAQIDLLVQRGVRGLFIPGNHDWDRFGPGGWDAIEREGDRIDARGSGLVHLRPKAGCPGPVTFDEGRWLRLVLLDTEWWLQPGAKPRAAGLGCPAFEEAAIQDALRRAVQGGGERRVVVVGHHPLRSGGEHGGFFDWRDHIFPLRHLKSWLWLPLPLIGSGYPLARNLGVSKQDLSSPTYHRMVLAFEAAFHDRPPLVYASGHDHGLQVIRGGPARYLLVSGAGIYAHEGPMSGITGTELALQAAGYMRLDILRDGRVRLAVITVDRQGQRQEVQSSWLESLHEGP